MTNILSNRVSATLNAEQIAAVKAALLKVRETLPFMVGLTVEERQALPKINIVNRGFTEDAISAIDNNPGYFPSYLSVEELQKDLRLFDQLDELVQMATQVCEQLSDTQMLAGSEAYVNALVGYKMVGAAASGGVPGAKTVYEKLKQRFEGQGNSTTVPADVTPADE
jgi:hypothetical protein